MHKDTKRHIAHIRQSDKCRQYVDEHNDNVAELAASIAMTYGLANLARIAGRYHDAGKNTPEFYQYILDAAEGKKVVKGSVIHSAQGALLINELAVSKSNSQLTTEILRNVILSHHGLKDCLSPEGNAIFDEAVDKVADSYPCVKEIIYQHYGADFINQEFTQACVDTRRIAEKIQLLLKSNQSTGSSHFYLSMFTRLLTSIVIDADRTDTACFEEQAPLPKRKTPSELRQMWETYLNHYEQKLKELQENKNLSALDPYRTEISSYCAEFDGGEAGIYRLVVPCGAGKTLAALRYALNTARRYGKERIIYIAPFNSILEQNAAEISNFIGSGDAVLEHHSNIIFDTDSSEDEKKYQSLIENWTQSPVIATTAVQFLNTLFAGKTSSVRRMQALGNSVIILDEIQALPIKILKLFNGAMNFLASFCKTSVVLCSATQPLLDRINDYRILNPVNMIPNENKYVTAFQRVKIENRMRERGYSAEEAGDFILEQAQQARSVLAIVNTKSCARNIYKYIRNNTNKNKTCKLFHLSNNMCPAHRSDALKKMRKLLDQKDSDKKIICISTSLIEAGVDVSFARVVRSLTGLDSIIQAAGRCNRHFEIACGIVSVINICDEQIGRLGYLRNAQEATRQLFCNMGKSPENYPEGLLSKVAMDEYYARYFHPLQSDMAYPLKNYPEHTLLDLLTTNPPGKKVFMNKYPHRRLPMMKQAFKEAGEVFAVIEDEATVDVYIEYNSKAKKWLDKLKNAATMQEKRNALRHLQPYIVQLKENERFKKEVDKFDQVDIGLWILPEDYYNKNYGVDETAEVKMKTLIV